MEDDLYEQLVSLQGKIQEPVATQKTGNKVQLVRSLNVLLANTVVLSHEAHGFHWNVKGPDFVQYHSLFDEVYGFLSESIDPTAENILKCGFDSPFHMSTFMKLSTIQESDPEDNPQAMAMELLKGINALILSLDEAFAMADDANEQGIADFIAGNIDEAQKLAWKLRASLGLQKPNRLI